MTIVYLHGFGSTGASVKVDALREKFGSDKVSSPDLPFDPDAVIKIVGDIVSNWYRTRKADDVLVFVGTSLGGFYANYFGQLYDCPSVLVNPSVKPDVSLRRCLGTNLNYVTGKEFVVTEEHLAYLASMREITSKESSGGLINLFLAKDDEVIPYESSLEAFPYRKHTVVTETGGHRFADNWSIVIERIEELVSP